MSRKLIMPLLTALLFLPLITLSATAKISNNYDSKIKSLIKKMTLEEKIGQLVQYSGTELTGPQGDKINADELVKKGEIGSFLNITGVHETRKLQKMAVEKSRLGIPLMFGFDVIHGYRTIFPVPIAMASSWDPELFEQTASISADEASACGVNWVFAPMVDIARDPRWGRIVEGFGEDPYLGSKMSEAFVKGFQKNDLKKPDSVMACVKHYVGYGAAQAGREYYTVNISNRTLWEIYMPPFKAAVDAGVGSLMPAFSGIDGVPMTANKRLIHDVLKKQWKFDGVVLSDWNAIAELINHGVAGDLSQAAELALNAGVDVDMMGGAYLTQLAELVRKGRVSEEQLNDSVYRVLKKKYELGLFDNPYLYNDQEKEKNTVLSKEHLDKAREVARQSIVLLKNQDNLLPLKKDLKTIAVIGPLADSKLQPMGPWRANGKLDDTISVLSGIKQAVSDKTEVLFAKGCDINDKDTSMIEAAVNTAKKAEVVIAVVGEEADMSGEAASRSDLNLPGVQIKLLKELYNTGIPVVVVLMNGRPLTIVWTTKYIPAILETWFLGTEAGHAIADVLFGDYSPSGKLTVTFPRSVGQIPIYYNHKRSGRPETEDNKGYKYVSKYTDISNKPLFPFGYGLSYTTFEYSEIKLGKKKIKMGDSLKASINITNTGKVKGTEIVQCYIHDKVATVTRPVKQLTGFKKITLKPGETKKVVFEITPSDLEFYNQDMKKVIEPGEFDVFIGTNSVDVKKATFTVGN